MATCTSPYEPTIGGRAVDEAGSGESKRRLPSWSWVVGVLVVVALPVLLLCFLMHQARQEGNLISCRNHATFVGRALCGYVVGHRSLPHLLGLPGEELFCRIDFEGSGQNCHAGAPGQRHGGWQMVNASPKSWADILAAMKGKRVPVLWCGRPHRLGGLSGEKVRVVLAIDQSAQTYRSITDLVSKEGGEGQLDYFMCPPSHVRMPEVELAENLAIVNSVLRANGEAETPINVEGRRGYWEIARPFQTTREP